MNQIEIRVGNLFATPPGSWWSKLVCRLLGAKTFHWGMIIDGDEDGWQITESIGKGVALTRLTYPWAYIYRIKGLEVRSQQIIKIHSHYGEWRYDWDVPVKTAIWWLAKHYFGKIIPRYHDKEVNCQEWVALLASELGVKIIPDDVYPMCTNLENSPHLELVGVYRAEC